MALLFWLNWTVNDSVEAAEDEGGWQRRSLFWRIANVQLLYHRNRNSYITGSLTSALYLVSYGIHNFLFL